MRKTRRQRKTGPIPVRLEPSEQEGIESLAKGSGLNNSEVMRVVIAEGLKAFRENPGLIDAAMSDYRKRVAGVWVKVPAISLTGHQDGIANLGVLAEVAPILNEQMKEVAGEPSSAISSPLSEVGGPSSHKHRLRDPSGRGSKAPRPAVSAKAQK